VGCIDAVESAAIERPADEGAGARNTVRSACDGAAAVQTTPRYARWQPFLPRPKQPRGHNCGHLSVISIGKGARGARSPQMGGTCQITPKYVVCPSNGGVADMPLRSLFGEDEFSPKDKALITSAFEDTLHTLGLIDRTDPAVSMVARRMIELARGGERDPILLRDAVPNSFRNDPGSSGL
jgi:hypothetical protein